MSFYGGGRQTNLFLEESAEQPKSVMVVVEITLIEIIKNTENFHLYKLVISFFFVCFTVMSRVVAPGGGGGGDELMN